jgi:hypothetical protein
MTDASYSFVYERASADAAFHGIAVSELMLALLATIPPEKDWEGCLVYQGDSPLEAGTICIGIKGPEADELQLRLVEALERQGVEPLQVYEGGPEARIPIAKAQSGRWSLP